MGRPNPWKTELSYSREGRRGMKSGLPAFMLRTSPFRKLLCALWNLEQHILCPPDARGTPLITEPKTVSSHCQGSPGGQSRPVSERGLDQNEARVRAQPLCVFPPKVLTSVWGALRPPQPSRAPPDLFL